MLAALTEPMLFPESIERRIGQVVDPRGDIKDSASPRLQEIRTELRHTRERVRRRLDGHLTQHRDVVQEPLITLRNNRYVIPLRPDYQRLLRGIVHDHSSSGATVFVEPLDVLDLNNRLVELTTAEDGRGASHPPAIDHGSLGGADADSPDCRDPGGGRLHPGPGAPQPDVGLPRAGVHG